MHRRDFLKNTGAFYVLGIAGTSILLESCKKSANNGLSGPQGPTVNFTLDLSQSANAALNTAGGSVSSNGVVVANDAGTFVAVAESCTHNGCNVMYDNKAKDFYCPCHGGTYDTNGNVTGGPPPLPLKKYTVTQSGHILTIAG
ncbi:MAG: QcrA and Rieske domain-containing protein [Bacteroidia bacterium]